MAEAYNFFEGTQTDINRRLLRKIEALEKKQAEDAAKIAELESKVDALGTPASDEIETPTSDENPEG